MFPDFEKQEAASMAGGELKAGQGVGEVIGLESRKTVEGKILKGLIGHCKNHDFYSEWDGKPLEDSRQRTDMSWFIYFRDR